MSLFEVLAKKTHTFFPTWRSMPEVRMVALVLIVFLAGPEAEEEEEEEGMDAAMSSSSSI